MMTENENERDPERFGAMGEFMDSWCVWSKFGRRPCYWHRSQRSAEHEAKRLARSFPGQKFIVLHAVAKFGVEVPQKEEEAA
jgi:hypothetical protein